MRTRIYWEQRKGGTTLEVSLDEIQDNIKNILEKWIMTCGLD